MKVVIEDEALRDLAEGFNLYEERESGAGWYFLDHIHPDLAGVAGAHRKRYGFHFCPSRRFPHRIYYLCHEDSVRIVAVLDCRRNPKTIRRVLSSR